MDKSQTFNILEVNKIKTNKLDYSYSNNIISINNYNSQNIVLDSSYSNYYLVTQDSNMDIILKLSSQKIGTKFRILITNVQKSLKISCIDEFDKFKGIVKISNNSGNINEESLNNNLKKNITQTSNISDIIYIPSFKLGLYNGGYIDLIYTGNKYCDKKTNSEIGYWLVNSELIGEINLPKNIVLQNTTVPYILTIYILVDTTIDTNLDKVICVTTKNTLTNKIYFNKVSNNNIALFLDLYYDVRIVTVNDNIEVYNINTYDSTNTTLNNYNLEISNKHDQFISLGDLNTSNSNKNILKFLNEFNYNTNNLETLNYNIRELYNTNVTDYNKLNILKYKIKKNSNTIIQGILNINSIRSYNNNNDINNNLPNLLFGYYNIFTDKSNNIILDESKY